MQSQYQSQFHMGYPGCQRGQSFKDRLLNNFSKKNKRSHCHEDFGFQPFFDQLGKKIESKVEECKVKAMEKINCKTQDLKGYLMKKMTETFTNSNANRPVPEERREVGREEAKADVQAVSQVVHRYEEQQVGSHLDSTVTCQYCNDNIIVGFMEEHVSSCIYRRENNMARCGDCGGYYKMTESQNHFRDCKGNIENINIQCEKCNDLVAMKTYFYHMSICGSQTINNRDQRLPQIPAREISECAICLLEIKRDGSGRFLECAHHFHSDCINDWAKKQKACPICMHQFE